MTARGQSSPWPSSWTDEDTGDPTLVGSRRERRPPTPPRERPANEPVQADPWLGQIFAERYVIESVLGEGGMGRVYLARHLRMSRRFAIKVLFGDQSANSKMVARFTREAEAASRLQHPNLVGVGAGPGTATLSYGGRF